MSDAHTPITRAIERLLWAQEELAQAFEQGVGEAYCLKVVHRRIAEYHRLMAGGACTDSYRERINAAPRTR